MKQLDELDAAVVLVFPFRAPCLRVKNGSYLKRRTTQLPKLNTSR